MSEQLVAQAGEILVGALVLFTVVGLAIRSVRKAKAAKREDA